MEGREQELSHEHLHQQDDKERQIVERGGRHAPFGQGDSDKIDRAQGLHESCQKAYPVLHPGRRALEGPQAQCDHEHVQDIEADLRYLSRLKYIRKIGEHRRDHRDKEHVDQALPVHLQRMEELV